MIKVTDNLILPQADTETPLDRSFLELSTFVSEHGPQILTVGMSQLEANCAILACLRELRSRAIVSERSAKDDRDQKAGLLKKLQQANGIIDKVAKLRALRDLIRYDDKRQEFTFDGHPAIQATLVGYLKGVITEVEAFDARN